MSTRDVLSAFGIAVMALVIAAGIAAFYDFPWLGDGVWAAAAVFVGRLIYYRNRRDRGVPAG